MVRKPNNGSKFVWTAVHHYLWYSKTVDKNIGTINIPIIIRLQGTNSKEAKQIIDNSGLEVISVISLQSAADKVKEVLTTSS